MLAYRLTVFTGAFLLFQVQPLIGKYILPWFGGSPGVWTICMLFFQMVLLGGYAYAHCSSRFLNPRAQILIHLALLAAALALLPITPADLWKPAGGTDPIPRILLLLTVCLGLPYFVLSSTGPLIQHWFSRTNPGVSPYRLYALSNVGSLLALLSYPFYFETHFTRKTQAMLWGWGLGIYVLCSTFCALKYWFSLRQAVKIAPSSATPPPTADCNAQPSWLKCLLWLLLPACACVLLLATTNKLCQDIAVIPFLWVVPLAVYLLSFIISFDGPRWYVRSPLTLSLVAALGGICWAIFRGESWPLWLMTVVYCVALFICCMVCHGELYRLRPGPKHLTLFYLMIAAGGALGGVFVSLGAPYLFTGYYELHAGMILCAVLFLTVCARDRNAAQASQWRLLAWTLPILALVGTDRLLAYMIGDSSEHPWLLALRIGNWVLGLFVFGRAFMLRRSSGEGESWVASAVLFFAPWGTPAKAKWRLSDQAQACIWLTVGLLSLGAALWFQRERPMQPVIYSSRNFYGRLRVFEDNIDKGEEHFYGLLHGRISHGWQFAEPKKALWPTLYYSEQSGVGLAIQALPAGSRRLGVVGLGVGTLASYLRRGDYGRFYEINPEVLRVAQTHFTYLSRCDGNVDLILGDARLSMEKEPPQGFDLLVLDAFSGDSIPMHLLTKESFEVYAQHLKTNGVIAVHISNRYVNLEPVLRNLAREDNYDVAVIDRQEVPSDQWWLKPSTWVLLTRNHAFLNQSAIQQACRTADPGPAELPLWTDDFASLFQILK